MLIGRVFGFVHLFVWEPLCLRIDHELGDIEHASTCGIKEETETMIEFCYMGISNFSKWREPLLLKPESKPGHCRNPAISETGQSLF